MTGIIITDGINIIDPPARLTSRLRSIFRIQNPQWLENQKQGRWNGKTPKHLEFIESFDGTVTIPRGYAHDAYRLCKQHGPVEIQDNRRELPPVDFSFAGQLRPYQRTAVEGVLKRDFGTLEAPTGSGKTVMAAAVIAERKQPTLIIVHTKELLNQWIDRLHTFLGIPVDEIGIIGSGKKQIGSITVAMVQTLYKCAEDVRDSFGFIIVDECHRVPSRTFTDALTAFDCKYQLGLTATPFRRDGLTALISWFVGPVCHRVDAGKLRENGSILKAEVITRDTRFETRTDCSTHYSRVISELTEDYQRNRQIAADVAREAATGGGVCLVLSDRKAHCYALQRILKADYRIDADLLTGEVNNQDRQEVVARINNGECRVLCATGQLIGEGFDAKGLSTMFLTTPIKFEGRLTQYLGRILRPAPGKRAKIYDYRDIHIGVLANSARTRQDFYKEGLQWQ